MPNIGEVLSQMVSEGDSLAVEAPPAWSQGRTVYGGMIAALCYEAAIRHFGVNSALRSALLTFVGPAGGRLKFEPALLRAGRSATIVSVDCLSGSELAARGSFAFGIERESCIVDAGAWAPTVPPPVDCPLFLGPTGGFHDNFECRLANGSPLLSCGAADFTVWVRFSEQQGVSAATAMLALADALPPAAMATFPSPAPISTMTWSIDFASLLTDVDDWHLLRSTSEHSSAGYSMQSMSLWGSSGALLANGRQTVALFI